MPTHRDKPDDDFDARAEKRAREIDDVDKRARMNRRQMAGQRRADEDQARRKTSVPPPSD